MNRVASTVLTILLVFGAALVGYWAAESDVVSRLGARDREMATDEGTGPVIYYRDPDGRPFYSLGPRDTPDGRPYRAVRASEDAALGPQAATAKVAPVPVAGSSKRVLYYRNPMGLPDISPTPKKDAMGMDYIPVYEGQATADGTVTISPGKLQLIGMRSEAGEMRAFVQPVRAPGTIQLDERRVSVVALRSEAFIERVENVTVGDEVIAGQALLRVYSPAVASAAAEYLTARGLRNDEAGLRGPRQRLLNFGVPDEYMAELERSREVPLVFTWLAPRDGIVIERNVVDGMRAMPGDTLFRVADHTVVWAQVDVAERDLALVREGQPVRVRVRSYPDRIFTGRVALVYPHLNAATRTVRLRIELANRDLTLRPDMYAEAEIDVSGGRQLFSVPGNAVIDGGGRQFVLVDHGEGRFEPRAVRVGRRGADHVEIRDGLQAAERVVTSANFLIDAESNLKSALNALAAAAAAP